MCLCQGRDANTVGVGQRGARLETPIAWWLHMQAAAPVHATNGLCAQMAHRAGRSRPLNECSFS